MVNVTSQSQIINVSCISQLKQVKQDETRWKLRGVKSLGIKTDNQLKFDEHIDNVYLKAKENLQCQEK